MNKWTLIYYIIYMLWNNYQQNPHFFFALIAPTNVDKKLHPFFPSTLLNKKHRGQGHQ